MAAFKPIDESLPFKVECDVSDIAISAALKQGRRPVAFISKTLQGNELKYLTHQHFTLITDQRSVAFMFSNRKHT